MVDLKFKFFDVDNIEEMQSVLDMSPEYSQEAEKLPNYLHWARLQLGEAKAYVAKMDVFVKKLKQNCTSIIARWESSWGRK